MNHPAIGDMYTKVWQDRMPSPVALADDDLACCFRENVVSEQINAMPLGFYEGPINLVRTKSELLEAAELLSKEKIIGFDTETRPIFKKGAISPVALIQLAGASAVWLIQLSSLPFNEILADLLAAPHIVKAGVAINDDMTALAKQYHFEPSGVADLGRMAMSLGIKTIGLRSLTANLLGFRISKNAQCSNWERDRLEPRQIRYAATDAWLGRELYLRLLELGSQPISCLPYRKG